MGIRNELDILIDDLEEWMLNKKNFWLKSFALDKNLEPSELKAQLMSTDRGKRVYARAMGRQEERIIKGGLSKTIDSGLVKLILENEHGWKAQKTESVQDQIAAMMSEIKGTKEIVQDDHG